MYNYKNSSLKTPSSNSEIDDLSRSQTPFAIAGSSDGVTDHEGLSSRSDSVMLPQSSSFSPIISGKRSRPDLIGHSPDDVVVICENGGLVSKDKKLGAGVFGAVYKLKYVAGTVMPSPIVQDKHQFTIDSAISSYGIAYAIKVISLAEGEKLETAKSMAEKEAEILKTVYPEWQDSVFNTNNDHCVAIIMPLQPGIDLHKQLVNESSRRSTKLPGTTRLEIAIRLIDAVIHICNTGYVHLDIKPANIMLHIVENDDEELFLHGLRVIDFGIAEATSTPIHRYDDFNGEYPHLTADRKRTHENDKKFTYAASRHDFFGVGFVLGAMFRAENVKQIAKNVCLHYDDPNNRKIDELTQARSNLLNLLNS